jgi:hypothetical protein
MFKDASEREVSVGELVVYTVKYGNSPHFQYGKVLEVTDFHLRVQGVRFAYKLLDKLKPSLITMNNRILKITKEQIPPEVLEVLEAK